VVCYRYVRQATAYEKLGDKSAALRVFRRALSRPELQNQTALVDAFIDLLTEGKGLPDDEVGFKSWVELLLSRHGREGFELIGTPGDFKSRLDVQRANWTKK
jgi:hypothetical protein